MFSINIMKQSGVMTIFPNSTYFNLGKKKYVLHWTQCNLSTKFSLLTKHSGTRPVVLGVRESETHSHPWPHSEAEANLVHKTPS